MDEGTGLKIWRLRHLQLHGIPNEFHTNYLIALNVTGGIQGETDGQTE
jgi:hypothetical protein